MKHGRQADHRGGLFHQVSHLALSLVRVTDHLRHRAVVADGAGQHEGHVVLHATVDDSVVDLVVLDELRDRAAAAHLVDYVQVVVVAVRLRLLGVDVLAQRRV